MSRKGEEAIDFARIKRKGDSEDKKNEDAGTRIEN